MKGDMLIITNNPLWKKREDEYEIIFVEGDGLEVFKKARDFIHKGHVLLTHPLVSSIKPHFQWYRTVVLSKTKEDICNFKSLALMEESIVKTEEFIKNFKDRRGSILSLNESIKEDLKMIDYDLVSQAIDK